MQFVAVYTHYFVYTWYQKYNKKKQRQYKTPRYILRRKSMDGLIIIPLVWACHYTV